MMPPYRSSTPPSVPAAPPRCLYCAAIVPAGEPGGDRACPRCGLSFEVTHEKRVGAPCPRCEGKTLAPSAVDDASVYVCHTCQGCFIHAADWDELLARADEGGHLSIGSLVPPPPGQGPTLQDLFQSVRCPVCAVPTRRFEFAGHAGLWLDVCPAHGLWLDAGELVAAVQQHKAHPDGVEAPVKPTATALAAEEAGRPSQSQGFAEAMAVDGAKTLVSFASGMLRLLSDVGQPTYYYHRGYWW